MVREPLFLCAVAFLLGCHGAPKGPTQRVDVDCAPDFQSISSQLCAQRSCSYDPNRTPACKLELTYAVQQTVPVSSTITRYTLSASTSAPFGGAFGAPYMEVENIEDNILRIKFADASVSRYEVPSEFQPTFQRGIQNEQNYEVQITSQDPFSFRVTRRDTGTIIFDTGVGGLVLSDQFLQFKTLLASTQVFGFGQNYHESFRHEFTSEYTWPIFNRDEPLWKGTNNYGTQPYYVCSEDKQGNAHGVLILNSNAQEYQFSSGPMLTYRTIGGILDLYFFIGKSMEDVTRLYTTAIGKPVMPPYWGLGFHLSRYGYRTIYDVKATVDRMIESGIPFDAQYVDIDYMKSESDFTIDNARFPGLNDYFHELRANGMRTVYMFDPCIITNLTNFQPYLDFIQSGATVKWPSDVIPPAGSSDNISSMLGWVWPDGKVIFPDFLHPSARQVWKDNVIKFRDTLIYDGVWIDMNEPANFGTNEERAFNWPESDKPYWTLKCPNNTYDDPPYRPAAARRHDNGDRQARLSDKTLCMLAVQGDSGQYRHYDVHNLYARAQAVATKAAVEQATGQRAFVLTRANFPGSGHYVGTWTGDTPTSWGFLRGSITTMLEYNLFGMPLIGADICGFFGDPSPELCLRWQQLGAFYPYSRNHNSIDGIDQDPAVFRSSISQAMRKIIETRYWLLPYLYTQFDRVSTQGGTVARSLIHEFPGAEETYAINDQFLWGSALLISPILYEGMTTLRYYLPPGVWYDFFTYERLQGNQTVIRQVDLYSKPSLSIRGGFIIPVQRPANNTAQSRKNPFGLIVALSETSEAAGTLFWDDGISQDTSNHHYKAEYNASSEYLSLLPTLVESDIGPGLYYDSITVLGLTSRPGPVYIVSRNTTQRFNGYVQDWDIQNNVLRITDARIPLDEEIVITWRAAPEPEQARVDCYPERFGGFDIPDVNKCNQRNCETVSKSSNSNLDSPTCVFSQNSDGYVMHSMDMNPVHGEDGVYSTILTTTSKGPFGGQLSSLEFRIEEHGENVLRFTFDSVTPGRFRPLVPLNLPSNSPNDKKKYSVNIDSRNPFLFSVYRLLPSGTRGEKVWSTVDNSLVFEDQFLQIANRLPSTYMYGLGENTKRTFKRDFSYQTYPIMGRDQKVGSSDTLKKNLNNYGTQPFYTCIENDNNAHGVLFFNSAPQDYTLSPLPMITYRTIGGVLDFFLFMGPTPEEVLQQYHQVIGKPIMPPYWGLGFALCKYGYNSLDNMKAAVDRTIQAGIPLDTIYGDIDHFDERRDFTYDKEAFAGLPEYFETIRANGMKTVIILDPAIVSNYTNYPPYDRIAAIDGNVNWPDDEATTPDMKDPNGAMLGWVWPMGKVVYPDFFNNKTVNVWADLIAEYRNTLKFDALWIDMNEPTAFGTNMERPFNWPEDVLPYWSLKCPVNKYDDPPYRTGASFMYDTPDRHGRLSDVTICMCAVQGNNREYRHYDVHNLYGYSQALATKRGLERALGTDRGYIISRSTFVGSGTTASHWLGDNESSWADMKLSIVALLDFNLFGYPFTGSDICGHFGSAEPELCKRWMQLGAFYGYSRNHNAIGNRDQDPGVFDELVQRVSREAMETRYLLLPYLYTLYHEAHINGGSVLRPLHHVFLTDITSRSINKQFMWGSGLLISPILEKEESAVSTPYYLPGPARWYDFYNKVVVSEKGGEWGSQPLRPDSAIPLHVRGGTVLPTQEPALNTTFSRLNPMSVIFTLDENGKAEGSLFWDDGTTRDTYENGQYHFVQYTADEVQGYAKVQVVHTSTDGYQSHYPKHILYREVDIWGVSHHVSQVNIQVDSQPSEPVAFIYNSQTRILRVMPLRTTLQNSFTITWQ